MPGTPQTLHGYLLTGSTQHTYYYEQYPHFRGEDMEAQKFTNLIKAIQQEAGF